MLLLIMLNLFRILSNPLHNLNEISNSGKITLKVKGTGIKNIMGHGDSECTSCIFSVDNYPNHIYINSQEKEVNYEYNFIDIDNTVEMIWDSYISTCLFLFRGCTSITEIDLSNFVTTQVTDMGNMFYGCTSLTSINLANLDTSNVIYMSCMFQGCSSLISLNLSSFDTSNVKYMNYMFDGCSTLVMLDTSKLIISNAEDINHMFQDCSSLTELNVSNFDTSQVKLMNGMFNGCSSLTSLNVSNFITKQTTDIGGRFYACSSLISLDLSNFDTSKVEWFCYLFDGCSNLEYINLKNWNENNIGNDNKYYTNMFTHVPENVVICINDIDNKNKIKSQINIKFCPVIDCSDDWESKRKKIVPDLATCTDECNESYKYEMDGKCLSQCNNYTYLYSENKFHCTLSCPYDFPILIQDQCIKKDIYSSSIIIKEESQTSELFEDFITQTYELFKTFMTEM